MSRRLALAVFVLAILAGTFALRRSQCSTAATLDPAELPSRQDPALDLRVDPSVDASVVERVRVAVDAPEVSAPPAAQASDPLELGTCSLDVVVRDRAGGGPASGRVELWRLAAPGNLRFEAGDQRQGTAELLDGRANFQALPSGSFRVAVLRARWGSEDPPPFLVEGPSTAIELWVDTPRSRAVQLDVRDTSGRRLRLPARVVGASASWNEPPAWVVPRRPLEVDAPPALPSGPRDRQWRADGARGAVEPGPLFYDLGEFTEASARDGRERRWVVFLEGYAEIVCDLPPTAEGPVRLAALAVSLAEIRDRARSADGGPLDRASLAIDAVSEAFQLTTSQVHPDDEQAWQRAVARIGVSAPGFAAAKLRYTRGAGPLPEIVLVRE